MVATVTGDSWWRTTPAVGATLHPPHCWPPADGLSHLQEVAERRGLILPSPDSKGSTWDFLRGGFGPDVQYIDAALQHVFSKVRLWGSATPLARLGIGPVVSLTCACTAGSALQQ